MLVPFSAKNSFGQAAKQLSERHFSFKSEGRALDVRVSQEWKDDDKGGTDIGFGACVYPGAYVLAEFLCANPHIVREKSVLELGSGTGLVSVVCASLGAARVTATDGDAASVGLSRKNLEYNGFGNRKEVSSVRYLWGEATENLGKVDVIVASDVVACPYVEHFEALYKTLCDMFTYNGVSSMLLVYERRAEVEQGFFERLKRAGFEMEEEPLLDSDFKEGKIKLFTLKKRT